MSLLLRARELFGRAVVTLDTAEDLAEIKDVVFNHAAATVVGFTLNKRGRFAGPLKVVLPWSRVSALGRDAVMVADRGALGGADDAMSAAGEARDRNVVGTTVMTDAGKALGKVSDLVVEVDGDARVVGFEVHGDRPGMLIPVGDTIAVSGQTLMVPAAAEDFLHDDLSGFGSAVQAFRDRLHGNS